MSSPSQHDVIGRRQEPLSSRKKPRLRAPLEVLALMENGMPQSIDDHGARSQLAPLAGPATEAYNLCLINVPALDLGSPDEPLFIDSFADVAPEPSGCVNPKDEELLARAAASISART